MGCPGDNSGLTQSHISPLHWTDEILKRRAVLPIDTAYFHLFSGRNIRKI